MYNIYLIAKKKKQKNQKKNQPLKLLRLSGIFCHFFVLYNRFQSKTKFYFNNFLQHVNFSLVYQMNL